MTTDYTKMPDESKVWVFPSQKKIYTNEVENIEKKISDFILSWEEKNTDLQASFTVKYNRFIVIFADSETSISTDTTNQLIHLLLIYKLS